MASHEHTSARETLSMNTQPSGAPNIVFQPRLSEIVELVNFMGNISEKVAEQHAQFTGGSGGTATAGAGTTQRDDQLATLPPLPQMQHKLISHIQQEVRTLRRHAKALARKRSKGWAYELNRLYAQIHRLTALAQEILHASIEIVKRFYVLVFIDHQPILPTAAGSSRAR
jgi:hypothetical protein